jgi:hypothetical protein
MNALLTLGDVLSTTLESQVDRHPQQRQPEKIQTTHRSTPLRMLHGCTMVSATEASSKPLHATRGRST